MEYVCVDAKFYFWDGQKGYTVTFQYGVSAWYIFKEKETKGALYSKKIIPKKSKSPNRNEAEDILCEYLEKNTRFSH